MSYKAQDARTAGSYRAQKTSAAEDEKLFAGTLLVTWPCGPDPFLAHSKDGRGTQAWPSGVPSFNRGIG